MKTKNAKSKKISSKKYLIAALLFFGTILLTLYIFKWYEVINNKKITESYLISSKVISNEINSLDELEDVFSEAPSEYFLYISYVNDKNIYDLEVDLKKIIKSYNLQDKMYYLNVDKDDNQIIRDLNQVLNLNDEIITSVPTIIYFKDNTVVNGGIINKEENSLMQASDFEQMLEVLEVEK